MSIPTVVVFDVYKTLLDLQTDEDDLATYQFLATWLAYKGLTIDPLALRRLYRQTTRQALEANDVAYPDVDIGTVFKEMLAAMDTTGRRAGTVAIAEMALLFRLLTTVSLTAYPEMTRLVKALAQDKARLGILSNTQRLFTLPELIRFDLAQYFECIVFSSDVKAAKPTSRIFEALLEEMAVEAGQVIFVGDNLFDDIWGAQQMGMRTVWLNRPDPRPFPAGYARPVPDRQINEMDAGHLYSTILSML